MNLVQSTLLLLACLLSPAQLRSADRQAAEYYAAAYASHYGLPVEFVRAVIAQESGWQACVVSRKGALGIMQLMPETAVRLGVRNRCNVKQNISGGVRYLAWLSSRYHGDLRLVAAAYYAGEGIIDRRGLGYSNQDVVSYVASVRARTVAGTLVRSANRCASRRGR